MAHLGEKLKEYRQNKGMTQPQMADFIDVGHRTYQDMEKTGIVRKSDVLSRIKEKTGIDTQKSAHPSKTGKKEGLFPKDLIEDAKQSLSDRSIHNLTESGKRLADAQKVMADNESRLITLLETKTNETSTATGNSPSSVQVMDVSRMMDLLEILADIAFQSGIFESKEQALREISIRLRLHESVKGSSVGTQTGAGKKSTV